MSNPEWPAIAVNFRTVTAGVECTMRTHYDRVDLSVSEIGEDIKKAEREAWRQLGRKVAQRAELR
jgi:uncharacterized protein with PIN domain